MKVRYNLQNIQFEWDSQKAESNLKKHETSFESACEVFFDPFVYFLKTEFLEREYRDSIIGMTSRWQVLYVVHTIREDDIDHVISARRATKAERRQYEKQ